MPHTSHRNRQARRPQRTKTTDANGWTTIQRGPQTSPSPRSPPPPTPSLATSRPSPPSTPLSVSPSDLQVLKTSYAHYKHLWATSTCATTLRTILTERIERNDISKLRNCVVLGLGSLASASSAGAARKSFLQLAALEEMLECLSASLPSFIYVSRVPLSVSFRTRTEGEGNAGPRLPNLSEAIYAQDPAFEALDVAFLASRGVTVLEVPGASERVGRGTVLYAPHCARSAYIDALGVGLGRRSGGTGEEDGGEEEKDGEVLRGAPVLVVGNDVRDLIDGRIETLPSMKKTGQAFLDVDERRSVAFPPFDADDTVFWAMRIYWRERGGAEDVQRT